MKESARTGLKEHERFVPRGYAVEGGRVISEGGGSVRLVLGEGGAQTGVNKKLEKK